jgi:hypothetical protein
MRVVSESASNSGIVPSAPGILLDQDLRHPALRSLDEDALFDRGDIASIELGLKLICNRNHQPRVNDFPKYRMLQVGIDAREWTRHCSTPKPRPEAG